MDDDLRQIDALFGAALYRADCPPTERLLVYQAGLLAPAEADALAVHLQLCNHCRSELELLAAPPTPGPGARLAAGLAAARTSIRAALAPAPQMQPGALRGGGTQTLNYTAGAYQVMVAIVAGPAPGALAQIEGQLLGAEVTGLAELAQGGATVQAGTIDDLGFFAFDGVAPGRYMLRLIIGADQIEVADLEVASIQ